MERATLSSSDGVSTGLPMFFLGQRTLTIGPALALLAVLSISGVSHAQQTVGGSARVVGTIQAVSGKSLTVSSDSGTTSNVVLEDATKLLQIEPGKTDLKEATPLSFANLTRRSCSGPWSALRGWQDYPGRFANRCKKSGADGKTGQRAVRMATGCRRFGQIHRPFRVHNFNHYELSVCEKRGHGTLHEEYASSPLCNGLHTLRRRQAGSPYGNPPWRSASRQGFAIRRRRRFRCG